MHVSLRNQGQSLQRGIQRITPVLLAVLVGGGLGALAIVARNASTKWAGVIIIAVAAPSVALLVNDIRKLVLIALVVDIPLGIDIAIGDLEWHQGGPTGYIVSLMIIALGVGYALWIMERRPKVRFFPDVTVPALLYLSMIVLSLYQAQRLQLSLFGLFLNCQFVLMYFYMVNHVKTWADIRLIMITLVICLLLESALMVAQYFTGATLDIGIISSRSFDGSTSAGATGSRVGGTIGGPNSAAVYLAPTLVITFGAYLAGKLVDKRLALPAFSLGVIALVVTASRSGWGSLCIGMLILLAWAVRTDAGKKAIVLLLLGGLLLGIFFGGQIQKRLEAAKTDHTRPELAAMAYNIMRDYPWGVGENNYDQVMSDKYAHPNWVGHTLYPVHNKYLLVWTETGPQGLIAFSLVLIAAAWQARRWLFRFRTGIAPHLLILAVSLLGAFAGYAFHMTTEGFASRSNVQILWFIIAMMVAVNRLIAETEPAMGENGMLSSDRIETKGI